MSDDEFLAGDFADPTFDELQARLGNIISEVKLNKRDRDLDKREAELIKREAALIKQKAEMDGQPTKKRTREDDLDFLIKAASFDIKSEWPEEVKQACSAKIVKLINQE